MLDELYQSYTILDNILSKGAYSSIELSKNKDENHKLITKIVYGVLDNYVKYDYCLSQLVTSRPKKKIRLIIIIGMYCINELNSMPSYAVVDNSVNLTKKIGKKQMSGFVNAILKKSVDFKFELPTDKTEYLSVYYSKPLELVKYLIATYGEVKATEIISVKPYELEHIRHNSLKISRDELERIFKEQSIENLRSRSGGYYIRNNDEINKLFINGLITIQSMTSMLAVQALDIKNFSQILDLCAAPGGKSVYMAELSQDSDIISCDIIKHRLDLIESYATRMGTKNIDIHYNDATQYNEEFCEKFDYVLCDVPCSGLGLIHKKPDIMLTKTKDDIEKLILIQYNIINNASKYLKKGGIMLYSTCSIIREENQGIIEKFLKNNSNYIYDACSALDGLAEVTLLPNDQGQDGFFIARMKRI